MLTPTLKSCLFYTGVALIALSLIVAGSYLAGLLNLPATFFADESTLHSIVRVTVIGCILAAIGSWEHSSSKTLEEQHHDATI